METFFDICVGLSCGAAGGMITGFLIRGFRRRSYTEKQVAGFQRLWKIGSRILTFLTALLLVVGLIWCVYFLIMGAVSPERADYADNMSELIVGVLTVISIIFAFYEFVRRKN